MLHHLNYILKTETYIGFGSSGMFQTCLDRGKKKKKKVLWNTIQYLIGQFRR